MNAEFYQGNRQRLYDSLPDHTLLLLFSGSSIRKTADENYPFYADRSFLYLTGIGQEHTVLMAEKDGEEVQETLYILPPDMLAERWTGKRFTPSALPPPPCGTRRFVPVPRRSHRAASGKTV